MKVHSILYYLSFVSYETNIILKNITFANVAQFVLFNNHVNGGTCEGLLTGLMLSVTPILLKMEDNINFWKMEDNLNFLKRTAQYT